MAFAREIRTKITSIKKTQKITKAMEMVAASKMRKTQDRMLLSRPYSDKMYQVIGHLARSHSEYTHPFLISREIKRVGYIIVSTDRGLCGPLNNSLFKTILLEMRDWQKREIDVDLSIFGKKGQGFFKRFSGKILACADHLGDAPDISDLRGVVDVMLEAFTNGTIDALYIGSNRFINTMVQKPIIKQLLPLPVKAEEDNLDYHWDYIYEPDAKQLLDYILERYIKSQVYQAVVENIAAEQASKMVAMKSASENAGELIDDLQLAYNKARQAAITKELAEIVSGAAAV